MLRIILLVLFLLASIASAQPKLVPHKIALKDGKTFNLNLPADYEIIPAAEGLKRVRGVVLEMNPDGSGKRVYARNIKNAVGLKWIGKKFYATNEGVDNLGLDKPDDTFYELKDGADYGWAKCFQSDGKITADPKYAKNKRLPNCSFVPASYAYFPAHSSALGFDFFDGKTSEENLKNSFLVALHGSTDRSWQRGYKIVAVRGSNRQEDFITGFVEGINTYGRPCDILKMSPDSFLFSDDRGGVVYFVRKKTR
jgi:glucose/arabinose dehydrogenase